MTVKELIEELKQFPEDLEVYTEDNEYGLDEPNPRKDIKISIYAPTDEKEVVIL